MQERLKMKWETCSLLHIDAILPNQGQKFVVDAPLAATGYVEFGQLCHGRQENLEGVHGNPTHFQSHWFQRLHLNKKSIWLIKDDVLRLRDGFLSYRTPSRSCSKKVDDIFHCLRAPNRQVESLKSSCYEQSLKIQLPTRQWIFLVHSFHQSSNHAGSCQNNNNQGHYLAWH